MKFSNLILVFLSIFLVFAVVPVGAESYLTGPQQGFYPSSSAGFVNYQASNFEGYYSSENRLATYWPILNEREKSCEGRQDILLQVAPGGCQPAVVRSDLLAEQNVPVFCQISALQINPLINVKQISNIRFTGKYPASVAGTGFHPAQAALRTRDTLLGSPVTNNIGYVVVVLKKNEIESNLSDFVTVNLSAQIDYESGNSLGIGTTEFVLEPQTDGDWQQEKNKQSFWRGHYSIRLDGMDAQFATISLYEGDVKVSTTRIDKGKTSAPIYTPGFYCRASLQADYLGADIARNKARIEVSDEDGTESLDVYEGSTFINGRCVVRSLKVNDNGQTGSVEVQCPKERFVLSIDPLVQSQGNSSKNVTALPGSGLDSMYGDANVESNFSQAIASYEQVADQYPSEKKTDLDPSYGELALTEAIELARTYGKQATQVRLMNKFIGLYPGSKSVDQYKYDINNLKNIDVSKGSYSTEIDNRFRNIRLVSLSKPSQKASATFRLDSHEDFVLKEGEDRQIDRVSSTNVSGGSISVPLFVKLNSMQVNSVSLTTNCDQANAGGSIRADYRRSVSLSLDSVDKGSVQLCGHTLTLQKIDMKQVAKIRLTPSVRSGGETNLSVRIGIEKRAIQLSPEKTQGKIDTLNETIKKWEGISNTLGNVVTGMKGACFATSAALTFKNFLTGLSGESIARQKVMQGDAGWTNYCKNNLKNYASLDDCFMKNSDKIDADVAATTSAINSVNAQIKTIESQPGVTVNTNDPLGGSYVNQEPARKALVEKIKAEYPNEPIAKSLSGDESYTELREIYLNLKLQQSSGLSQEAKSNVISSLKNSNDRIVEQNYQRDAINKARDATKQGLPNPIIGSTTAKGLTSADVKPITSISQDGQAGIIKTELLQGKGVTHTSSLVSGKDTYYLGLTKGDNGVYGVTNAVKADGTVVNDSELKALTNKEGISAIREVSSSSYNNRIVDPEVRYYETEPYKGMPAIVPFDVQRGWYAATRQTLPAFGGIGAFDASGRVTSFWLCNVGSDGRVGFDEGMGDDICQLINLQTGQPYDLFPGLSQAEAKTLVGKAVSALQEASRQYAKGDVATVNGERIKVGRPMTNVPGTNCQDFMSPKDCYLMFNVCDPVICPASRCNLGGKYQVADVVQSGVVGSIFLCLPNIKEGIAIPVCVSGVKAGLDGYISVMKSYKDCLQENLNTGKLTGVCDQIYSVYLCEFFWRQVAPIVNVLIPKLVETAYGQGVRGGGEYMTVTSAWTNAKSSVDYFTNTYAVNSLKAFQARSVEEAGGEFCKAYISVKAPKAIKTLLEPDSPSQFYASFSSVKYSDATVPATSQYKVFYHIFAGQDSGTYYSVYLKSPADTSFYHTNPTVQVDSGFIARGQYYSQTKDFTAPEGYKELCVRINDKENCGFKEVTTDFGINYLRDSVVKEELTKTNINSEQECISGSPGLSTVLLNTNVQQAAQEAITPQVYNRGVVRVCSTENPGKTTNPSRFVEVGTCGDQKVRCWLDQQSVKNAIGDANIGLKNETLSILADTQLQQLQKSGELLTDDVARLALDALDAQRADLLSISPVSANLGTIIVKVAEIRKSADTLLPRLYLNNHKAFVGLVVARANGHLALAILDDYKVKSGTKSGISKVASSGAGSCGNGVLDANEECEFITNVGYDFGIKDCTYYGYENVGGHLSCNDCKIDSSTCSSGSGSSGATSTPVTVRQGLQANDVYFIWKASDSSQTNYKNTGFEIDTYHTLPAVLYRIDSQTSESSQNSLKVGEIVKISEVENTIRLNPNYKDMIDRCSGQLPGGREIFSQVDGLSFNDGAQNLDEGKALQFGYRFEDAYAFDHFNKFFLENNELFSVSSSNDIYLLMDCPLGSVSNGKIMMQQDSKAFVDLAGPGLFDSLNGRDASTFTSKGQSVLIEQFNNNSAQPTGSQAPPVASASAGSPAAVPASSQSQFTLVSDSYLLFSSLQKIMKDGNYILLYIRNNIVYADIDNAADQAVGSASNNIIRLNKAAYDTYPFLDKENYDLLNNKKISGTNIGP